MTHPNTDQGVTAEVTQADRKAAVDIHNVILHDWFTQHMLDGMEDECYVIQAFARHRLSSTAALEARCRELSKMLGNILGGGSEWFSKVGDEHYIDPKLAGPELQRRKTDACVTKKALFRDRAEIASLKQRLESAEGIIEDCHQLLQCVEQTSSNVWWVNADDPETAVCDTFGKVEEFLKDERMVTCHIALQEQEKQNG